MFKSTHLRLLQAALDQVREIHRIELHGKNELHRIELHAKEEKCIELRASLIRAKKQRDEARAKLAEVKPRYQGANVEPEDPNLRVYKRLSEQEQWEVDSMRADLSQLKIQSETLRQSAATGDEIAKANYQGAQQAYMACLEQYGPVFQRYGIQYQP